MEFSVTAESCSTLYCFAHRGRARTSYTDSVKRDCTVARITKVAATLERIVDLETQLAAAPVHGRRRHGLRAAIRIEADAYRKSLDIEQASATHDPHPRSSDIV